MIHAPNTLATTSTVMREWRTLNAANMTHCPVFCTSHHTHLINNKLHTINTNLTKAKVMVKVKSRDLQCCQVEFCTGAVMGTNLGDEKISTPAGIEGTGVNIVGIPR